MGLKYNMKKEKINETKNKKNNLVIYLVLIFSLSAIGISWYIGQQDLQDQIVVDNNTDMQLENNTYEMRIAKCLAEKNVKMYGSDTCPACIQQKNLFGEGFKYISYINCQLNSEDCYLNQIQYYPTWDINGTKKIGVTHPTELADIAGCKIE